MKRRATPTERMTACVFREAGACLRQNVFLTDQGHECARQIEVLAQDLPCYGGIQLRSAVCASEAHAQSADHDGAVLLQARQDKEATHPELASSGRCKLVMLTMETGGRWSEEAVQTLQICGVLCGWTRMLAIACAVSFASSLGACAKCFLVSHGQRDATPRGTVSGRHQVGSDAKGRRRFGPGLIPSDFMCSKKQKSLRSCEDMLSVDSTFRWQQGCFEFLFSRFRCWWTEFGSLVESSRLQLRRHCGHCKVDTMLCLCNDIRMNDTNL